MFRLAAIAASCVLVAGCGGEPTPEIMAGVDGCASCGMVIDRVNEAAGWIEGGDFVPFCSPGCLLAEHDALRRSGQTPPEAVFLADYRDGTFAPAVEIAFLLTDHVPTVMNARVVCFNSVMAAGDMRQHEDEIVTDWTGYRVLRGEPDTVIETVFGPGGIAQFTGGTSGTLYHCSGGVTLDETLCDYGCHEAPAGQSVAVSTTSASR